MKKLFFAFAAIVAMSFAACGDKQAEGGNAADSTAVAVSDTTVAQTVDTLVVDSIVADTVVAE